MKDSTAKTSKLISYWLRHQPEEAGLVADDFGWVSLSELLESLQKKNAAFQLAELIQLNNSTDKVRWEIDQSNNRIRATHGHSFPVLLEDKTAIPPATLYHGTSVRMIRAIAAQGLRPMSRQFVHLSSTIDMATTVGKRHGKPFIIEIATENLLKDGWIFYETGNHVYLTTAIPPQYLAFKPWFPVNDGDPHFLEELKTEIGNRGSHPLFHKLASLKPIWKSLVADDVLYQDQRSDAVYQVHLTYPKQSQEHGAWPKVQEFKTIDAWTDHVLLTEQAEYYG